MTEVIAMSKSEDLWSSYKALKRVVLKMLTGNCSETYAPEFETILRKHKQNFFSLLQNQPKNAKNREELKKGVAEGITVKGLGHQILTKELYQETIILSDMFEINEYVALDLLCTAQIQSSFFPGLPRGLVAVLLYYDGRCALVKTLKYLVQARIGVQWSVENVNMEVLRFITMYTDQLMEGGLFNRIFDLLRTLDLSKEIEKLQENLALGGARHRRQVMDLFNEIRVGLADIVYTWSAQCGLPKAATLALINYLRNAQIEEEASGKLDNVNLYLQMALLCSLDLSVLHTREDGEDAVQNLPIISDPEFIQTVANELAPSKPKWKCEGLQALSTFGLSVCIASLRIIPQGQQFQEVINKEETYIDAAIEMNVFEFIHNIVLENELVYTDFFQRLHNLVTDFIVYMYPKVKELRIKADEIARTVQIYAREGLEAPQNLPRYFEHLLLVISKLYKKDNEEVLNYWSPVELHSNNQSSRASPRAVSLFKFIRLAGDMVPVTLFVPYLTMLGSLSACQMAARHCFNMMKQVGPQLTSNLSWDHFFSSFSQYYNNLRQEVLPVTDTVYRSAYIKGVSPQELEGLHAVLQLIRRIADHDEFSRLALCEHPGWVPMGVLLGLVGCSVPIPLKADLLLALTSLSKSAESAAQMWENLEASQILQTIPNNSSYAPRGIQTELEEIESRMEEYPLTRAFMELLDVLTDFGIPRTLGAGPRRPGFDPYLNFIVNSVFLKFNSRSYRNPKEKWEVANLCLKLFEKFLSQYDPQSTDFPGKHDVSDFNPPPGYHLMIQLNNKSELLSVILDIIDECNKIYDGYVSFPTQKLVDECTLHCLNIICNALHLQPRFLKALAVSSASVLLTHLPKLLLTINRRSGKPDHCINIAKYLSYHPFLPEHEPVVVKILSYITSTSLLHNQFMNILLSSDSRNEIKHGFVSCLDNEDETTELKSKTRLAILKLLKQCLAYNPPSFSHFLLGFDMRREIYKMEFQYAGVMDFPRSCLHSIISLMEKEMNESDESLELECAYEMLYNLASNSKTSRPVLRFVRLNPKFFTHHITTAFTKLGKGLNVIPQMSWLLKTLAIEFKITCESKQVSYLKQLTNFLVNLPEARSETNQDPFSTTIANETERNLKSGSHIFLDRISNNVMMNLIPFFDLNVDAAIKAPEWQYFDGKVLSTLLENCNTDPNTKMIDLKKLHQRLYDELRLLQGTAVMGQIQAITQEIPKVLKFALELNKSKEKSAAVVNFVEAWRQLAEVLMIFVPQEILSVRESQLVGICFMLNLLKKIPKVELLPQIGQCLSGSILLTLENILKCHNIEKRCQKVTGDESVCVVQMHMGSLKEIFSHLIEWIMVSNVTDENLKVHLYTSLVILLELTNIDATNKDIKITNSSYVSRLDSSRYSVDDKSHNVQVTTDVLTKFGERLVEVFCQDCVGGYAVSKMQALSSFGVLIALSGNVNWIVYMSGRGYLKFLIESVFQSNSELEALLQPNVSSMKPLYSYLGKSLFMARLAGTRVGAELLLENKLFACYSNMSVISCHPTLNRNWSQNTFDSYLPTPEEIYLQIFLPTLEISNVILTTLGIDNQSAVAQVVYFLLNHIDVVELVLRSGDPSLSIYNLKELALLTSVIARTADNNLVNVLDNPEILQNNRTQLFRIQKLMLALLPKFILSQNNVKELIKSKTIDKNPLTFDTSERLLHAMQVMVNLLCYSRNVVANNDVEHGAVGVIFQPTLKDPNLHQSNGFQEQPPSMGSIIQQLISTVSYRNQEKFTLQLLQRKIKEVPLMDNADLNEFVDSNSIPELSEKREYVYELISDRLEKKQKEMDHCSYIIENAMYLIWVHLDYYMLKAIPKANNFKGLNTNSSILSADSTLASATEATWKVSTDDISELKHGLVSIFNDSFIKQLTEAVKDETELDKGFIDTLLRKIMRLIQFVPVK